MSMRLIPRSLTVLLGLTILLVGFVSAQAATPTVQVRYDNVLGHFLTDAAGMSLYVFSRDGAGVSNCDETCAANWPPALVEAAAITSSLAIPGSLSTITRADGSSQLAYNGWPLYTWVNDGEPGHTTGHEVGGVWWLANLNPAVQVATHPELGQVLVGPTGMTLYTFAEDTDGVSNCSGSCATNWPPLVGGFDGGGVLPAASGADGRLAWILREDGSRQLTYDGAPLYYWRADQAPGQVTGDGVGGNWWVARP